MKIENDGWFRVSVLAMVIAIFAWALSSTLKVAEAWVPWIAILTLVVALGSVTMRAALRSKDSLRPDASQLEQRLRFKLLLSQIIPTFLFSLSFLILINLVSTGVLTQWVGASLFLLSLAALVGFHKVFNRNMV